MKRIFFLLLMIISVACSAQISDTTYTDHVKPMSGDPDSNINVWSVNTIFNGNITVTGQINTSGTDTTHLGPMIVTGPVDMDIPGNGTQINIISTGINLLGPDSTGIIITDSILMNANVSFHDSVDFSNATILNFTLPDQDSLKGDVLIVHGNGIIEDTLYFGDSTYLVTAPTGSAGWSLTGNTGTDSSNFIGTTDANPLTIKVNNYNAGYIGISPITDNNTIFGYQAGDSLLPAGLRNAFFGLQAGFNNSIGYENAFFGMSAGEKTSSGSSNTFLGYSAGLNNTTGGDNVFVGADAGLSNTTSGANVFVGVFAGHNNTSGGGVFVGKSAGYANTTGGGTFIGTQAGVANTTGVANTFLGSGSGYANTSGGYNTLVGSSAGSGITTGGFNICVGASAGTANTTGDQNIYIGLSCGNANTSGHDNIFIGNYGGYFETGSNMLIIDNQARTNLATARTNSMFYGVFATDITTQTLSLNATVTINSVLSLTLKADPPATPAEGMIYADTDHHLYYYNGTSWVQLDN